MIAAILLIVASLQPYSPVIVDHAAVYELNHFYDEDGRHVFDQLIWWDDDGMVQAWRTSKRDAMRIRGGRMFWDQGDLRLVKTESEIETWEQVDRELEARRILPQEGRKEFSKRP